MATAMSQEAICSLAEYETLILETEAGHKPNYSGVVLIDDMLLVVEWRPCYLQVYDRHYGKLIISRRLEYHPENVCLISKTEVAVCLDNGTVEIMSLKSIDDVKLVKTLKTVFLPCDSLAKLNSDKLVISGRKKDDMLCWGILSITDGRLDSTHVICKGGWAHMAVKDNTVYISCVTDDSITNGVYAYDILNPHKKKFLYQHQDLEIPSSIMVDRDYVYVCDYDSNTIHQLTDSGQLVTIHTVSSRLNKIFYDDQHGLLYTTSNGSNVITFYKMESLHQPDSVIPAEVLKMDTRSLQMYKKALNDGKENVYNIRVMVVGQYGVGKTTLTQRLLGENVNISERHSTDGIDVHVECSKVSLSTGEWTTQEKKKLHQTVLNRCLPNLMKDLNVQNVMMYIQQQELFDDVTIRDINEQTITTDKISHLIHQIKQRDKDTYERFKECLILAQRADLKKMLEEEEKKVAAEMKHQDPRPTERKRAETSATKKSNICLLM